MEPLPVFQALARRPPTDPVNAALSYSYLGRGRYTPFYWR